MTQTLTEDPVPAPATDPAEPQAPPTVPPMTMPPTPRLVRPLFRPKRKPPSELNKRINRAFVRANVYLYRRSRGRITGRFMGMDVLLITTIGRKTGISRTNAVTYLWDSGRFVVCAAYGGEIVHPAWYLNLMAVPRATVDIGMEQLEVTAEVLPDGPERDRLWGRLAQATPMYGRYQTMTSRLFPIVLLTPVD
jgi:deazaflavin-dependent oxidoreductase (nitroreductase family)